MEINDLIGLLFLGVGSYGDWKEKRISLGYLALFGAGGVGMQAWLLFQGEVTLLGAALGFIPGILLLGIGKGTGESLGYGDGLAVLVLGSYAGLCNTLVTLMWALFFAALWAIVLTGFCRKGKKERIPFLPFLFMGMCLQIMWKLGSGG